MGGQDYKSFLKFLHDHGLKTSLNLHPATGVACHEDMYEEMATACGIDPATKQRVPLDILSPDHMEKYFDILHHPYEEDGVDFWWMDWQQGADYWWIHDQNTEGHLHDEREILDPLWMLNHLHIADIQRNGNRPLFFSRFSGPGSHRYPIGFSGDTFVTWKALDFQPYFTATASNIGYGWWSHDIGGHMYGYTDEELTIRWMQLGVFSPINRLHSANIPFIRKEAWNFEPPYDDMTRHWLRLRHRLFPYIYTMNERCYMLLEPIVQPMYYAYPKCNSSYAVKNQFMFGSELMVAPITSPHNAVTQMGCVEVWFPQGDWFDFFTGLRYASQGETVAVHRQLEEYPVFAKAGAIVPMQSDHQLKPSDTLEVFVFPGRDNTFTIYEDAGESNAYQQGDCVRTTMQLKWDEQPIFVIHPAEGQISLLPHKRRWMVHLRGYHRDLSILVYVDDQPVVVEMDYEEMTHTWTLAIDDIPITSCITIKMMGKHLISDNSPFRDRIMRVLKKAHCQVDLKTQLIDVFADVTISEKTREKMLYRIAAVSNDHEGLISAVKEQLFLTPDSDVLSLAPSMQGINEFCPIA